MIVVLRIVIKDEKMVPGTVLSVMEDGSSLGAGELGKFLCIKMDIIDYIKYIENLLENPIEPKTYIERIEYDKELTPFQKAQFWRRRKAVPLELIMNKTEIDQRKTQADTITNTTTKESLVYKEKFSTTFTYASLVDTPKEQWPRDEPLEDLKEDSDEIGRR